MKAATLAMYRFTPQGWAPIEPKAVPEWLKDPAVVADLVVGAILEREGEYYRALKGPDCPLIIPDARRIKVAH